MRDGWLHNVLITPETAPKLQAPLSDDTWGFYNPFVHYLSGYISQTRDLPALPGVDNNTHSDTHCVAFLSSVSNETLEDHLTIRVSP